MSQEEVAGMTDCIFCGSIDIVDKQKYCLICQQLSQQITTSEEKIALTLEAEGEKIRDSFSNLLARIESHMNWLVTRNQDLEDRLDGD